MDTHGRRAIPDLKGVSLTTMARDMPDWEPLKRVIEGDVILPGSPGYEQSPKPFNARFRDVRLSAIVRCAAARDASETISFARRHGSGDRDPEWRTQLRRALLHRRGRHRRHAHAIDLRLRRRGHGGCRRAARSILAAVQMTDFATADGPERSDNDLTVRDLRRIADATDPGIRASRVSSAKTVITVVPDKVHVPEPFR